MKNDDDFIHLPELYIKLGTLKKHLQKTYKLNINPMKNSDKNVNWSDLNKNLNAGYDDEKMAMISCDIIHEYAVKLDKVVKEDTELEEWVKSKIAKTEQMMASVKHALIGIEKYDHGGELFKQQLLHIGKYAQAIIEVLQDGTELMSWMESNLAVCADHMDNVYHHLDYKMGNRAKDLDKMKNGGGVSETPIAMMREVTGKSVGTVPVSEEIYSSQVNDFVNYVYEVYAEQGYTKAQVKTAVNKYIKDLGKEFTYGGGDSLDRERVYEYLLNPSLKGIKNPMMRDGGGVKLRELDDVDLVLKLENKSDFDLMNNEYGGDFPTLNPRTFEFFVNFDNVDSVDAKEINEYESYIIDNLKELGIKNYYFDRVINKFNYANGGGVDENDEYELKVKPIKEEYRDSFLTYWTIEYRKKGYKKPLFSNPFKKSEADWTPLVPKEDEFSIFLNEHCISISIGEYQEAGGNQKVEEEIAKNLNDKYGIIDAENQRAYWTWPYNEKTKEYRLRIFNLYSKKELAESIAKLLSANNDKFLKEVLRRKQEILQEEKEEKEAQENYKKPSYFADGGGIGSGIGMIELHFTDGRGVYINPSLIGHIYSDEVNTRIGVTTNNYRGGFEVTETPEEIIELIKSAGASSGPRQDLVRRANKMANGGNVGRDAMFRSQEPHEQRYNRKREWKEYKKDNWLANDWFDNGGGVGTKYYVMDAKSGDVVSKGFDTEEESKVEMYRMFEETGNIFLTQKTMANGGGVGYFKSGYTLKGRKGKYWIDDVEGRVTKDRYFEKEEDAIAEIDLLSRFKKLKNEQRVKGPSMENLMEADRYYAEGGEIRNIKGDNLSEQIANGRKFKELIQKVFDNQSGEHKHPIEFITAIAKTKQPIVKSDGKNYIKGYSYKGTISHFDFLDDSNFVKALDYVDRPAIRKFEDGAMMNESGVD